VVREDGMNLRSSISAGRLRFDVSPHDRLAFYH
jgi:hypothetical protein